MNAKTLEASPFIRALFIGKSGSRKSTIAASFPKPFYQFDFDGRIGALRGQDIDYDSYPRISGWGKAEGKFESLLTDAQKGTLKYKTVHIASITTILDFFLWEAKQHYSNETSGGLRIKRPNSKSTLLMSDMPHYKFVHAAVDDLLYNYIIPLSLVCNVIVEAHEVTKFDKEGDPVGDQVLATPAISERLPTTFDETWQFKFKSIFEKGEKKDEYRIHFRNSDLAKTTFRSLPDSVVVTNRENVFYDEVFTKLRKGETL